MKVDVEEYHERCLIVWELVRKGKSWSEVKEAVEFSDDQLKKAVDFFKGLGLPISYNRLGGRNVFDRQSSGYSMELSRNELFMIMALSNRFQDTQPLCLSLFESADNLGLFSDDELDELSVLFLEESFSAKELSEVFQYPLEKIPEFQGLLETAGLNTIQTLDSFVFDGRNSFLEKLCEDIGERKFSGPVLLTTPSGAGRSHFLNAIGLEFYRRNSSAKVLFISAGDWVNRYVDAIRQNEQCELRNKFCELDLLIVDDLELLESTFGSTQELAAIMSTLEKKGATVIGALESERGKLPRQLRQFFEGGAVFQIVPPGKLARHEMVERFLSSKRFALDKEAMNFLAEEIESPRRLKGVINRLLLISDQEGELSISEVEEALNAAVVFGEEAC